MDWLNNEIKEIGKKKIFHKNYEETLAAVYGDKVNPNNLVVEGGEIN